MDERRSVDEALVAAGRRLAARGLVVAAEGNLSARVDGDRIVVTPTGRRKDELSLESLVEVSLATGEPVSDGRPTSDLAIHRAIYAGRADVVAIAHAHLPAALALTLAGEVPDPGVLPETALHLPRLPFVPYGAMGSEELAARIAAAFAPERGAAGEDDDAPPVAAVLLERHGSIAVGEAAPDASPDPSAAIARAVDRLELVDLLCRVWRDARLLAPNRPLGPPGILL